MPRKLKTFFPLLVFVVRFTARAGGVFVVFLHCFSGKRKKKRWGDDLVSGSIDITVLSRVVSLPVFFYDFSALIKEKRRQECTLPPRTHLEIKFWRFQFSKHGGGDGSDGDGDVRWWWVPVLVLVVLMVVMVVVGVMAAVKVVVVAVMTVVMVVMVDALVAMFVLMAVVMAGI